MAVNRKLVAVVMADVVGYSRLMERDEAGTHERLRTLHRELIAPKIAEHGGRTVKSAGDGILLEFSSATSALRCAVEIQREMGARNLYVAPDERIQLRIGINLGDIIVEGDDILGVGVNVAARLETLAEPGGICVASAVWEQVHEDLGVEFIDAGEQHVKNISKPIRVFRVALGKGAQAARVEATAATATPARRIRIRHAAAAAAFVAVAIAAAVGAWWWAHRGDSARSLAQVAPIPRSLMVIPYARASTDVDVATMSEVLTEEVTRRLADTVRNARVVAPTAAAGSKGKAVDYRQAGRDANVRYLMEGDVRLAGDQIVVTTRLVDAAAAMQTGSERQAVARTHGQPEQEQLVGRIVYAVRDMLDTAERRRAAADPP